MGEQKMMNEHNTIILGEPTDEEKKDFSFDLPHQHLRETLRVFKRIVHNDIPVSLLDVGCKDSANLMFFRTMNYNWHGVDINPKSNNIIRGDMHNLPFGDEAFGMVFCCHTLEHSHEPIQALKEMKRVAHDGSFLFISTPAYSSYQIDNCDKTHITVPTLAQMRRWCELAGLKVLNICYYKYKADDEPQYANLVTICKVVN